MLLLCVREKKNEMEKKIKIINKNNKIT